MLSHTHAEKREVLHAKHASEPIVYLRVWSGQISHCPLFIDVSSPLFIQLAISRVSASLSKASTAYITAMMPEKYSARQLVCETNRDNVVDAFIHHPNMLLLWVDNRGFLRTAQQQAYGNG